MQKATSQIGQKKFCDYKVKNAVLWTYVISDEMLKKLLECFVKRNCRKQIKKLSDVVKNEVAKYNE